MQNNNTLYTNRNLDWRKYLFAFVITAAIFATAIYISNYFGQKKIQEIRSIQDKIAVDILSSETQFSLLEESACTDVSNGTTLSQELGELEDKLSSTENDRGADNPEVLTLKRYYALLEIKDYVLMQKISQKCKTSPVSIIYFYSTDEKCPDCEKEGYVLTHLRQEYPTLRVYSFDYNLDLSAVRTLISINKISLKKENTLPVLIIDGKTYYGFQSVEALEQVPSIKKLKVETEKLNSTTTSKKV